MSVVNVELPTDGLFLTLGNMIPPFLDTGFVVLEFVGIVFDSTVFWAWAAAAAAIAAASALAEAAVWFDGDMIGSDTGGGAVVVGIGGSVNSSMSEYLRKKWFFFIRFEIR